MSSTRPVDTNSLDLVSVGAVCSDSSCQRLDFLAALCPFCKRLFCAEHLSHLRHACPEAQVDRHCALAPAVSVASASCATCSSPIDMRISGCKCEKCGLLTCLRHRTFEAHRCAVWLEEKRRAALKETTGAELSRPHTATCRRAVRMMNTRKTSVGKPNLETSERLDVVAQNTPLRDGAPLERYYMHFPKAWCVSRVVDALAAHFDLPNPHSSVKPWALVNVSREGQLLTQLAQSLEDAGVQNGDVLTLVRVEVPSAVSAAAPTRDVRSLLSCGSTA